MRTISGTYYDGQSSQPYSVEVTLKQHNLTILGRKKDSSEYIEQTWLLNSLEDVDFTSSETVHLKYGNFPHQSLLIKDTKDVEFFREAYPQLTSRNIYRNVLSGNVYKVVGISFGLMVAVVAFYMLVAAPFIAEKAVNLVPPKAEVVLGDKMTEHLFASMTFDADKSETLNDFFDAIGLESSYPIKLHLEDSDMVNAFAVPGGKIVVFQGIIDRMDTWEELAGLLGHELAHVEQQHSLKQMSRSLSTYLVFSIMTSDVSGISAIFLENSFMLRDLANSRSDETEADEIGLQYLVKNNINPKGMVDLFKVLQAEEGKVSEVEGTGKKIMKIMSTHPLTEDRVDYLSEELEKYENTNFPENKLAQELFERLKE